MGLTAKDIYDLRMCFEVALNRTTKKFDKQKKLQMRRKIRDEISFLFTWEKPSPSAIINRWEDRLFDVDENMPFGFKEEFLNLLIAKCQDIDNPNLTLKSVRTSITL